MSNIVERLRDASYENAPSRCMEAAREIERLRKKLEEIHDITQDTTLHIECWQKLQNIAATAASALSSGIRKSES